MSTVSPLSPISQSPEKQLVNQGDIKSWKEISKIAWNIISGFSVLYLSMLMVAISPSVLIFEGTLLDAIDLFSSTVAIYTLFGLFLKDIQDAYSRSKDLYSFWKGHEVERT
ncbi:MAG: hypothetical protein WCT85_02015 [Parachlamydiales bacterium]|jgi:hypothetical protein